jgi:hypothetical protein
MTFLLQKPESARSRSSPVAPAVSDAREQLVDEAQRAALGVGLALAESTS